jgi:hypothetical protein
LPWNVGRGRGSLRPSNQEQARKNEKQRKAGQFAHTKIVEVGKKTVLYEITFFETDPMKLVSIAI